MNEQVVCIPNFSEGRRPEVVHKIVEAIKNASGVNIVDYSSDIDHNRSVITFTGSFEDVRTSILQGVKLASELIDLNMHKGGHPRIGAADVVPIVPLRGTSMQDAIKLSHEIGRDISRALNIPVYFYELSASANREKNLSIIRKGGFESLKEKQLTGNQKPDLGPDILHPTAGATVVGARNQLIAYNINLASSDMEIAKKIAAKIRSSRETNSRLTGVKAIAVLLKSRNFAQISTNITEPLIAGITDVYKFVEYEAAALGVNILESELIGAVNKTALPPDYIQSIKLPQISSKRFLDY